MSSVEKRSQSHHLPLIKLSGTVLAPKNTLNTLKNVMVVRALESNLESDLESTPIELKRGFR